MEAGKMTLNLTELTLTELMAIYPEQLWLEFSPAQRENAWQKAHRKANTNAGGRWRAFLNILCCDVLQNWLKQDPDFEEGSLTLPTAENLASIWEVVNGTPMSLGETRLVIIPTDESNLKEFLIPQEWLDIPSWTGHYYLAVQVNLDESWLRVCGYTSYQKIREKGIYDPTDRTYAVEIEDLIEDLALMWVAIDLFASAKTLVKPLPVLSAQQVDKLLQKLGKSGSYSPRMEVVFEQWGALLESDAYRQQLYQRRGQILPPVSQWLETQRKEIIAALEVAGWQLYQDVFKQPALAFRAKKYQFSKQLELENKLVKMPLQLVIELEEDSEKNIWILPKLQPINNQDYLPENIELMVFEEEGENPLVKKQAGQAEKCLTLPEFGDSAGTQFEIKVVWGESCISEYFVI